MTDKKEPLPERKLKVFDVTKLIAEARAMAGIEPKKTNKV